MYDIQSLSVNMASVPGVHRTGPLPAAADYSKTLLHALVDDETQKNLPIGSVSRIQLLLMSLVERVHDAIYVLPRHARDVSLGTTLPGPAPDPMEYARDVASALKALKESASNLPNDEELTETFFQEKLNELNQELVQVRNESVTSLEKAKEAKIFVQQQLKSYSISGQQTDMINTP